MPRLAVAFVLALLLASGDAAEEAGREGNASYARGDFAAAATAYRVGLDAEADSLSPTSTALQHNLGLALHRQADYPAARAAFARAADRAGTDAARVRALYNAGVSAAAAGTLDAALGFFRRTLLLDPAHADARFNYEVVARRLAERQPTQPQQAPPEDVAPSAYARRLKARAEAMAAQRRYASARALLRQGLQRDSTVAAFRDFMQRLDDIVSITNPEAVRDGATLR